MVESQSHPKPTPAKAVPVSQLSASYHPHTLALERGRTAYEDFHEWAHVEQHFRNTATWRLRARWLAVPLLGRVANLAVEIEAAIMAWREMRACGVWRDEDGAEAKSGLLSHARGLVKNS